jgi:hypothetical protein
MTDADDQGSRLSGEAAWKAHRDAVDRRNAAVKNRARDEVALTQRMASGRAERMAQSEELALRRLNERIERDR